METRTENLTNFIAGVTAFMKTEKMKFTEKFYEGIDRNHLPYTKLLELRDNFNAEWKIREDELYKEIGDKCLKYKC